MILSDIQNRFFTDLVRGIEDIAYEAGYSIILANANEDPSREADYLELAVAEAVSGIILVPTGPSNVGIDAVEAAKIPIVAVDRTPTGRDLDCVLVDNVLGGRLAVKHLLDGGFHRVACITGRSWTTTGSERLEGYRRALEDHQMTIDPELVRHSDPTEAGGYQQMRNLLGAEVPPAAVFVTNNEMTVGALRAIKEAGLRVPTDIGLVAFDDEPWATLIAPPLTTVAQPTYDLGTETAHLMLSRLRGYAGPPRHLILAPELKVRESSAPAHSNAGVPSNSYTNSKDGELKLEPPPS